MASSCPDFGVGGASSIRGSGGGVDILSLLSKQVCTEAVPVDPVEPLVEKCRRGLDQEYTKLLSHFW